MVSTGISPVFNVGEDEGAIKKHPLTNENSVSVGEF
jgi:hypothetical protein